MNSTLDIADEISAIKVRMETAQAWKKSAEVQECRDEIAALRETLDIIDADSPKQIADLKAEIARLRKALAEYNCTEPDKDCINCGRPVDPCRARTAHKALVADTSKVGGE